VRLARVPHRLPGALLLVLLALAFAAALNTGSSGALLLRAFADWSAGRESAALIIVREIRLPRALAALAVGATLGAAGAALQGMLRNPLAEPGLVGTSSCAALGAVLVLYFGLAPMHSLLLPAAGILGALLALALLRALVGDYARVATLILAGVALNAFAGAAIALALNLAPSPYAMHEIVYWLMGSVANRSFSELAFSVPFMLLALVLLFSTRNYLEALSLGEDTAHTLGFGARSFPWRVMGGVAIGVGAAVAISGTISFVGLVVPHLLRPFVGHSPGRLLLPCALGGALLVLLADVLVQSFPGANELKLGVVTSLLGAPFFLAIVLGSRSRIT
jgi:iron complex transport system permease protein